MTRYSSLERDAVAEVAARVLADPASDPADVASARRRLLMLDGAGADFDKLDDAELHVFSALLRRVRGIDDPSSKIPPVCAKCRALASEVLIDMSDFDEFERDAIRECIAELRAERRREKNDEEKERREIGQGDGQGDGGQGPGRREEEAIVEAELVDE